MLFRSWDRPQFRRAAPSRHIPPLHASTAARTFERPLTARHYRTADASTETALDLIVDDVGTLSPKPPNGAVGHRRRSLTHVAPARAVAYHRSLTHVAPARAVAYHRSPTHAAPARAVAYHRSPTHVAPARAVAYHRSPTHVAPARTSAELHRRYVSERGPGTSRRKART